MTDPRIFPNLMLRMQLNDESKRLINELGISVDFHPNDGFTLSKMSDEHRVHVRYIDYSINEAILDFAGR